MGVCNLSADDEAEKPDSQRRHRCRGPQSGPDTTRQDERRATRHGRREPAVMTEAARDFIFGSARPKAGQAMCRLPPAPSISGWVDAVEIGSPIGWGEIHSMPPNGPPETAPDIWGVGYWQVDPTEPRRARDELRRARHRASGSWPRPAGLSSPGRSRARRRGLRSRQASSVSRLARSSRPRTDGAKRTSSDPRTAAWEGAWFRNGGS